MKIPNVVELQLDATLVPPDMERCQVERPNGANFMTLGGTPALVRCTNAPAWLAVERVPGRDGKIGHMTLCEECKPVLIQKHGADFAHLFRLEP